ncbi:MAG: hypothetical protein QM256_03630 [Pseudomonadota bacterium]|jgi:hypothetical protein|nr:hypothetical protein [Syntrophaceae bacterium]MBP7034057.1 hypothetical protein [Syntrophobacterales bacterium]MDI9554859.1 hypothetical protein [Pseudomonadota bacterium]NLX32296.1 hypothetical protein [Deltaproteobacteria bacterium]HNU86129.1 hypothetical protein [Syntrophales bacterium]
MSMNAWLQRNPFEVFTQWSEESVDLMIRGRRQFQETAESLLGVFREGLEMKPVADPIRRLCGNLYELLNFPVGNGLERATWEDAILEIRNLADGMTGRLSASGFAEQLAVYGKTTGENGSRVSSACIGWMKRLVLEQKITADREEARQAARNCLEATESFLKESFACCLDQLRANYGLLMAGVMKENGHVETAGE